MTALADRPGHDRARRGDLFRRRLIVNLSLVSAPPVALIVLYIIALVRLPPAHLRVFLAVTAVSATVLFPLLNWMYHRLYAQIADVLNREQDPSLSQDERVGAFRTLTDLPRILFVRGMWVWLTCASLVSGGTWYLTEGLRPATAGSLFAALFSGGVVLEIFLALLAKRIAEPERLRLARALGDPDLREASLEPLGLSRKLRVSLVGVTVVTVAFAILLSQVRSTQKVESFVSQLQAVILEGAGSAPDARQLEALRRDAARLGAASELALLDAAGERVLWGRADALVGVEWEALRAAPQGGSGEGFDSPNVFSWLRLSDGRVLVASIGWGEMVTSADHSQLIFGAVLAGSALLAWLAAWLLAADVTSAVEALGRQAESIAEGDLGGGEVFDAEDELGALGRSFDRMRGGLRGMMSAVAETATRVESATVGIGGSAQQVGRASAAQVDALAGAAESVDRIQRGSRGIADSSDELARALEDSTSSAHEMGAVGAALSDTAASLAARVDTVSSAVEQMAASIREVARSADALSEAAGDTSGSVEEMASSVRGAEQHAGETQRLSQSVITAAERGRERVAQTIRGMEVIRSENETARSVIGSLGARATEIGSILGVITGVADETNLLALNAAIISAQAGEHGRAFAVVADQVKDLADRVLSSTREIEERVGAVQRETGNAVAAIERGAESVASGVSLSAEAGESLEEITQAARESGGRIEEIVSATGEQSKSAAHVVELMESLQAGVERIRRASLEQDRGNELILNEVTDMRHAGERVSSTTREQQAGAGQIRDAFERVGTSVERIRQAIADQVEACARAAELFEGMRGDTHANQEAVGHMSGTSEELLRHAEALRERVRRFRLEA